MRLVPDIAGVPEAGLTYVTQGTLESGFAFPGVGLALLTEHDLTGQRGTNMRDAAKMPARRRNAVDLAQLQPGDLVLPDPGRGRDDRPHAQPAVEDHQAVHPGRR